MKTFETPDGQTLEFRSREALSAYEWQGDGKRWRRPKLDGATLLALAERSTWNGLWRVALLLLFLGLSAAATVAASRVSLWLAVPFLYLYYFFYGFWVAPAHELQHRTVFAKSFGRGSEVLFYFIQALIWNSPTYARISHQLHHRYTMVRGVDPETDWPEVITTPFLRKHLKGLIKSILFVGAIPDLFVAFKYQISLVAGHRTKMMKDHCSDAEIRVIRMEALGILVFHVAVLALTLAFQRWELFFLITIAWQVGAPIETLWHSTEHMSRMYDANDQRLVTRSVRVSPFVGLIFWGLDDHVDHHMFPSIPSRNLPKLHKVLKQDLAEPMSMVACWREMFAVAREKESHPLNEHLPCELEPAS